jgi:Tfp pilus assembly protein PilW
MRPQHTLEFSRTHSRPGAPAGSRSGISLIEFMFVMVLTILFTTVIVSVSLTTGRSFAEIVNYVDLDRSNRTAMDNLSRDIRQTKFLCNFSSNRLDFMDKDGILVSYQYSPTNRALTKIKNGTTTLLLSDCDSMNFAMYQRSPLSNSYNLIPVTAVTNCKVVTVGWNCSRSLFGFRANTEPAQLTRIVIRNK